MGIAHIFERIKIIGLRNTWQNEQWWVSRLYRFRLKQHKHINN
jgi:hypothetical protein